jgi:competence protein ComEC
MKAFRAFVKHWLAKNNAPLVAYSSLCIAIKAAVIAIAARCDLGKQAMDLGDPTWKVDDFHSATWDTPSKRGPFPRIGALIEAELARNYHQLPLFVPVGLGAGVIAWFSGGSAALWPVIAAAAVLFSFAQMMERGSLCRRIVINASALLLIGFALISWRAYGLTDQALEKPWFGRFYAQVERVEAKASLGKEYFYLNTQSRQELPERVRVARPLNPSSNQIKAGDIIAVRARLMPPAPPAVPGAYDFSERAFFQGLGATGSALGPVRVVERKGDFGSSQSLQRPLSHLVQSRIGGDAGAIAATLASGDRGGISSVADEWMRGSGMAHLLSISGLHVTALVGTIYILIARCLALFPIIALRTNIPLFAAAGGAVGALFYTWLTGGEVPTIRSCVAAMLILLALAMGREPLSMRMLAIGATIVIVLWPEAVMGPSFQLSFAAVAAIIALHDMPSMRGMREKAAQGGLAQRFANGLVSLFLTGLLVEITLSPIALYHFQQTGLYGALANLIAIPLTTFVIMPLVALSLAFDWTGMAGPLWSATGLTIDALLYVAEVAATAPGAKVMAPTFPPVSFGIFAIGLCVVYLLTTRIRWFGMVFVFAGITMMASSSAPDILVDSSGRHLAIRDEKGRAFFLHIGKGEFVQDMMQEQMGQSNDFAPIVDYDGARCNKHICLITIRRQSGGRPMVLLATRSKQYLDYPSLIAACSAVDLAISDRPLPKDCKPKWLKADLYTLRKSGGLAIYANDREAISVAQMQKHLPWSVYRTENDVLRLKQPQ